jgi:hypothetical protein|tara:strand:- start:126 stop:455 length:330 start_codon:yes stop_codon:yes gene_type:complete
MNTNTNNNWTYANLGTARKNYVDAVLKYADLIHLDCNKDTFTRTELRAISTAFKGKRWIPNWITHDVSRRAGRGEFSIPEIREQFVAQNPSMATPEVTESLELAGVSDH